jgi:hypothetical protein
MKGDHVNYLMAAANAAQTSAEGAAQGMQGGAPPTGMTGAPPGGMDGGPPGGGAQGLLFGPTATYVLGAVLAVTLVVLVIIFWRLFAKAGRPRALGLLMAIPLVNLGLGLWIAFSTWPIEKEAERARLITAAEAADAAEHDYPYDAPGLVTPLPEP